MKWPVKNNYDTLKQGWKRAGIILIILFLSISLQNIENADSQEERIELSELRTSTTKTFKKSENSYQLVSHAASIHYREGNDWLEIDSSIMPSQKTGWSYEVEKGHWTMLVANNTTTLLEKDGLWLKFRFHGVGYLDTVTKDYVILREVSEGIEPNVSGNEITWSGIFPGAELQYTYSADHFRQELRISQAARDYLAANPPSSYGLSNSDSYLVIFCEIDWSGAGEVIDSHGSLINYDTDQDLSALNRLLFRDSMTQAIKASFPIHFLKHDTDLSAPVIPMAKRLVKKNGKHWLLFGAPVLEANAMPAGVLNMDPSVTFNPDANPETSTVDGLVDDETAAPWADIEAAAGDVAADDGVNCLIGFRTSPSSPNFNRIYRGIILFNTESLPDNAILNSADVSLWGDSERDDQGWNPEINIYESNPASNTQLIAADYAALSDTPLCDTARTLGTWSLTGYNDFELNAAGLALINLTGVTKLGVREAYYDAGPNTPAFLASNQYAYFTFSTAEAAGEEPRLTINYAVPYCEEPSSFIVADMGAISVNFTITKGTGASYTMIRADRNDYPDSVNNGELIYYGAANTINSTGYALETTLYLFSAWGYFSDNSTYSANYSMASIGGEDMEQVATELGAIATFLASIGDIEDLGIMFFELTIMALLVGLAIREKRNLYYNFAAGLALLVLTTSSSWKNDYTALAFLAWVFSAYFFCRILILALTTRGKAFGWSQVKSWFVRGSS